MPSWSHTVSIFTILKTSFIQVFTVGLTTIEIVEGDTEKCILIVHLEWCVDGKKVFQLLRLNFDQHYYVSTLCVASALLS